MVHILMGPFGSGKTEISINLALRLREMGENVSLVDLDVITPYFRIRDVEDTLRKRGILVVTVENRLKYMDLPIIPKHIERAFSSEESHVVIDLGGDDDGARVISSLKPLLKNRETKTYFVINVFRPFSENVREIVQTMERLSNRSRLHIDFLVNNSNLGPLSTKETLLQGEKILTEVSTITGIPVKWTVVLEDLASRIDVNSLKYPVFKIKRFMKTLWEIGR
ncbi:hypothetical protein [Thermotoga sp. KOL6]|uniref:nucleotide-binding protein n=1 Tax=Thermotoga sp. KOL6 TaxID=126741 RepID=UPI000C7758C5|nr:hypothetical protein [Thermotoga sp. KOL6]PLV60132.1 hypothetical protein AS005_02240 [Thermotoga sp. KOL6]